MNGVRYEGILAIREALKDGQQVSFSVNLW